MSVRVTRISVLLNSINVEKKPQKLSKIAVVNNRLGNEFNKGGAGK